MIYKFSGNHHHLVLRQYILLCHTFYNMVI